VLIMPMRRRQKKHQELLSKLTKGDRVITNGGIFGTVVDVEDDKLTLRIAEPKVDIQWRARPLPGSPRTPEPST